MSIAASLDFPPRTHTAPRPVTPELVALEGVAVLAGLPLEVRAALAAGASVRRFARRGLLAAEGSAPAHVFAVLSGRVRAVRRSDSGREVTLETFQRGDLLADGVVVP
ncbi:MAG: cyclic nucleotide-binding domain-containing protein, partial [Myxococcales bacterium]